MSPAEARMLLRHDLGEFFGLDLLRAALVSCALEGIPDADVFLQTLDEALSESQMDSVHETNFKKLRDFIAQLKADDLKEH